MVAGGVIFNRSIANELPLLAALGVIIALVGMVFVVYQRWFNLGWLVAVAGLSMVALGMAQESAIFGRPLETPNVPLAITGAIIAVGGLIFFAFSYSAYRRQHQSGQVLQDAQ
jgi:hypothetical protein